jgi:hypothetical protein
MARFTELAAAYLRLVRRMSTHIDKWPFDQQRNCAVFTVSQILDRSEPVLHVTHDSEDHGWQFLTLATPKSADARIVALEEMVSFDPSVLQLADLPPGWHAWRRSIADPWTREPNPNDTECA